MDRIGIIGVGNMGRPIALRLIEKGYELSVFDISSTATDTLREHGAKVHESSAAVACEARTVMVSLPTPEDVSNVALGPGGLVFGSEIRTYIDLSTTGVRTSVDVAKKLGERGIAALDCPVTGGVSNAKSGSLTLMVSGPMDAYESQTHLLDTISKAKYYVGKNAGDGQLMKLANNLLSATALASTCEAMVLGVKFGLNPEVMIEVLNAGSGRNSATEQKFPAYILPRTFNAGFSVELMNKDLRLCMEEADVLGVPMWIGEAVRQIWKLALSQSKPNSDITTIIGQMESWAGITIPKSQ